jgi:hypothetical protein
LTDQSLYSQILERDNAPKEIIIHLLCKRRKGKRIDIKLCENCTKQCDKYFNLEVVK